MPEDWLKRQIEVAGSVLAALIFKQRGADLAEASESIESTCLNTIGLKLEEVKRMTPESLRVHLEMSGANRIPRSVLLAELLLRDAETSRPAGEEQEAVLAEIHAYHLLRDNLDFLSAEEKDCYRPTLAFLAQKLTPNSNTSLTTRSPEG